MKKWKHINFEQRKTIASGISHNMKVKDLGKENIFGFKNSEFSGEGYYRVRKVSENKPNVKN